MKSQFKIFLSFLVFGMFVSSSAIAQNFPDAQISADIESVYLPDGPLVEKYEINFINWDMEKAQLVTDNFDEKSPITTFELDYPNSRIVVTLHLDTPKSATWGFDEWKSYLINMD